MKGCLFCLALSFICSLSLSAQTTVNFGIKGGANLSTFNGTFTESMSFRTAPYLGGIAHIAFSDSEGFVSYVLQPELVYSVEGAKEGSDHSILSYINIPVMIQRYIASSGFYLETGPQIGFLMRAREKTSEGSSNIKSDLRPLAISLNGGIGYKFNNGLGVSVRVSSGLNSVSKGSDARNVTISGGLFYVLGQGVSDY